MIYVAGAVDWDFLYQDDILGFVAHKGGIEPRSKRRTHQQKVPLSGPWIILVRDMLWHPRKAGIQDWVDFKALEFAQEESKGYWLNPTEWLSQYLYVDIHDIFFSKFLIVLHEWLSKLTTQQRNFQWG